MTTPEVTMSVRQLGFMALQDFCRIALAVAQPTRFERYLDALRGYALRCARTRQRPKGGK